MKYRTFTLALSALIATVSVGCVAPGYNPPPTHRLTAPGPGVTGPGPGVLSPTDFGPVGPEIGSVDPATYDATIGAGGGIAGAAQTAQVYFVKPDGMQVYWDVSGSGQFDSTPLIIPGKYNFQHGAIYRLKLTNIAGAEGVELYPTLEIGPVTRRTLPFLAHNAIPFQLTVDDVNQIRSGNFVTKVLYLPDPEFQELAVAGVDTLVSTRLEAGVDPVVEADRRGAILAIVRVGNKDMEIPGVQVEESYGVGGQSSVVQAGYACDTCAAGNVPCHHSPQFGMPITGTPIGLPGPPHIPLGVPAGLQKHVIKNHTRTYIPDPTKKVKIHVKQSPRIAYPEPRDRAWINQYNHPTCGICVGSQ